MFFGSLENLGSGFNAESFQVYSNDVHKYTTYICKIVDIKLDMYFQFESQTSSVSELKFEIEFLNSFSKVIHYHDEISGEQTWKD